MSGKEVILRTPGSTLLTLLAWSYKVIFVPEGSNAAQYGCKLVNIQFLSNSDYYFFQNVFLKQIKAFSLNFSNFIENF